MLPSAIVIYGASSSGKTTLARALQELFLPEVWLAFSVDHVIYSLPESILQRCNQENDWSGVDGTAVFEGATKSLRALLKAGNRVIFDAVISNVNDAAFIQSALKGFEVVVIELQCDLINLEQRASFRGDRTIVETRRSFEYSNAYYRADLAFDSAKYSADELAIAVVEKIQSQAK